MRTRSPGSAGEGETAATSACRTARSVTFGAWNAARTNSPTIATEKFHEPTVRGSGVAHSAREPVPPSAGSSSHRTSASDTAGHGCAPLRARESAAAPGGRAAAYRRVPDARGPEGARRSNAVKFCDAVHSSTTATSSPGAATAGVTVEPCTATVRATDTLGVTREHVKFAAQNRTATPRSPPTPGAGRNRSHTLVVPFTPSPKCSRLHAMLSASPTQGIHRPSATGRSPVSSLPFMLAVRVPGSTTSPGSKTTVSPPFVSSVALTSNFNTIHSPGAATTGHVTGGCAAASSAPVTAADGVSTWVLNHAAANETSAAQTELASSRRVCSGATNRNTVASCRGPNSISPANSHTAALLLPLRGQTKPAWGSSVGPQRTSPRSSTADMLTTTRSPPDDRTVPRTR
ncbi:hypothetical protein DIPPA_17234 [Diplonema papillatum]|nr:hypothetical protein DIPPA_17234 [Diplonema papillatum]